MQIEEEKTQCK